MAFIERLSWKERFSSPGALALFGAFAVPEPFGTIILAYAAFWWWRSRKKQIAQLAGTNAPLLPASLDARLHAELGLVLRLGRRRLLLLRRGSAARTRALSLKNGKC